MKANEKQVRSLQEQAAVKAAEEAAKKAEDTLEKVQ